MSHVVLAAREAVGVVGNNSEKSITVSDSKIHQVQSRVASGFAGRQGSTSHSVKDLLEGRMQPQSLPVHHQLFV